MKRVHVKALVTFTALMLVAFILQTADARIVDIADRKMDTGRYFALVIGIDSYRNLPKLKTARDDASDIAAILREKYGFNTTVLLDATRARIIRTLDRFRATLQENDNFLIYYAGHGVLDAETDTGFWLPADAEADNEAEWIDVNTITRNAKAMASRHVMIVADSCYSGTLTRAAPAKLQTARDQTDWLLRMNEKRSRTAMTSGGLEPVLDGGGGKNSVFARAFIDALRENRDIIAGHHLFRRLRVYVTENSDQTPEYADIRKAGHDGGDFIFVPVDFSPAGQQAKSPHAQTTGGQETAGNLLRSGNENVELAYWQTVEKSDSIAAYQSYLERWPSGSFADIARIRIDDLRKKPSGSTILKKELRLQKQLKSELREEIALEKKLEKEITAKRKIAGLLAMKVHYASPDGACRFAGADQRISSFGIALTLDEGEWKITVAEQMAEDGSATARTIAEGRGVIPDDGIINMAKDETLSIRISLHPGAPEQDAVIIRDGQACRMVLRRP